jgi:hypothetical protein
MSPEQAYQDTIEVSNLQTKLGYYEALAKVMEQYLALNPEFNGNSRKRVEKGIEIFHKGDVDKSMIEYTLLGMDTHHVPESLWNSMDQVRTEHLTRPKLRTLLDAMTPNYVPSHHYRQTGI